jgi:hypothetical protein
MEATLKRKMWKVTIVHFTLTFVCGLILMISLFSSIPDSKKTLLIVLEGSVFALLQPQFWFAPAIFSEGNFSSMSLFTAWMLFVFYFISVPFWSYCFGWLFVKSDNWLNHFSVLGRKVF